MTSTDTPKLFTQFETDEDASTGVMWRDFVTAVGLYVYTNESARKVTVADVAMAFNVTVLDARAAAQQHPWLYVHPDADPTKELIESDGA